MLHIETVRATQKYPIFSFFSMLMTETFSKIYFYYIVTIVFHINSLLSHLFLFVFFTATFSFVGNTEIDIDIKKYYCRAGIKSIQVWRISFLDKVVGTFRLMKEKPTEVEKKKNDLNLREVIINEKYIFYASKDAQ